MENTNTIIIGAGRLGGTIARSLNKTANVVVVDRNKEKIGRLGDFSGFVAVGDATDRALLEKNGIKTAYRVIAVTDDDNTNIFLADLCTNIYHVPQVYANSLAADEMNAEIAERFGTKAESMFEKMEGGYSLWCREVEWHAYWSGTQMFLLISAAMDGDSTDISAYGYDFKTDRRITNAMILEQKGITEEEYLENLREKVTLMFEDKYRDLSEEDRERAGYDKMLENTLGWLDMEQPMYLDGTGEIVTIVKIASIAGAGWYYHFATPFAYG